MDCYNPTSSSLLHVMTDDYLLKRLHVMTNDYLLKGELSPNFTFWDESARDRSTY